MNLLLPRVADAAQFGHVRIGYKAFQSAQFYQESAFVDANDGQVQNFAGRVSLFGPQPIILLQPLVYGYDQLLVANRRVGNVHWHLIAGAKAGQQGLAQFYHFVVGHDGVPFGPHVYVDGVGVDEQDLAFQYLALLWRRVFVAVE